MRTHRSISDSTVARWDERWNAGSAPIACWESTPREALGGSAARAATGQLVVLPWKGGVEKATKKNQKFGTLFYLAIVETTRRSRRACCRVGLHEDTAKCVAPVRGCAANADMASRDWIRPFAGRPRVVHPRRPRGLLRQRDIAIHGIEPGGGAAHVAPSSPDTCSRVWMARVSLIASVDGLRGQVETVISPPGRTWGKARQLKRSRVRASRGSTTRVVAYWRPVAKDLGQRRGPNSSSGAGTQRDGNPEGDFAMSSSSAGCAGRTPRSVGCHVASSVTKKTTILVVGDQVDGGGTCRGASWPPRLFALVRTARNEV